MSFDVFSGKLAQEDRNLWFKTWFWAWGSNLEFPEFGLTLERGDWRSSVEIVLPAFLFCFEVRSSGIIDARAGHCVSCSSGCRAPNRAWFSPIQHFWLFCRTLERVSLRSSGNLYLHVRSSGVTYARAWPLFSENSENAFKVHLCILISS